MSAAWPDDLTEAFKVAYAEGLSHSELAQMFGVSRNAAIGKAYRLRLPGRPISAAMKRHHAKRGGHSPRRHTRGGKPSLVRMSPVVALPRPQPPSRPTSETQVSLMDAKPSQCRFIIGESNGPETVFCGAPGRPWCPFHRRLAYQPITKTHRPYVPGRVSA